MDIIDTSFSHYGGGGSVVVIAPLQSSKCDHITVSHVLFRREVPAGEYLRKINGS
jgi:hypothetical protein